MVAMSGWTLIRNCSELAVSNKYFCIEIIVECFFFSIISIEIFCTLGSCLFLYFIEDVRFVRIHFSVPHTFFPLCYAMFVINHWKINRLQFFTCSSRLIILWLRKIGSSSRKKAKLWQKKSRYRRLVFFPTRHTS